MVETAAASEKQHLVLVEYLVLAFALEYMIVETGFVELLHNPEYELQHPVDYPVL